MWALLARGASLGGLFKKGKDLGSRLTSPFFRAWDWFRSRPGRTYQPPPPGVKERHDPFTALALLFTGGIAGAINLGFFGEIFKQLFAAVNGWINGAPHPYWNYGGGKKNYGVGPRPSRRWDYSQPKTSQSHSFAKIITKEEVEEILKDKRSLRQRVDGFGISGLRLTGPEQKRNG